MMFGLRAEIIAAILALALAVIGGGLWRMHWLAGEVDRLNANNAALASSVAAEKLARKALEGQRRIDELTIADRDAALIKLTKESKTLRQTLKAVYDASAKARAWRDEPVDPDVLASLRHRTGNQPTGSGADQPTAHPH